MSAEESHNKLAARLRQDVLDKGIIDAELREGAMAIGAGEERSIPQPYDALARQIDEASYRVTDAQVDEVRTAAGSEKAAFELVMSSSIGTGLRRWHAAIRAIEEATRAPS